MKDVPLENIANGLKVSDPWCRRRQSVLEATQTATLADAEQELFLVVPPIVLMEAKNE
jgi:hypothetical protein